MGQDGDRKAQDEPAGILRSHNRNPHGKNQYSECPSKDDPDLQRLLLEYHHQGVINREQLSKTFQAEHGIKISPSSIARCRAHMGLKGPGATTREVPDAIKRHLVSNQMAKDPTRRRGPRLVRENIARDTGVRLTRDYVEIEMRRQDPDGFAVRDTHSRKNNGVTLIAPGRHYEWRGDSHDQLSEIGFPVWAIRDSQIGEWLSMKVVPNNRMNTAKAYLYLTLVHKLGVMPIQSTIECGAEITEEYEFASTLREALASEISTTELPAHQLRQSIHNTVTKYGWLRLHLRWGENVKDAWNRGKVVAKYDSNDPQHYDLVQWLWPKLIQQELDKLKDRLNNNVARKENNAYPSAVIPNAGMPLTENCGVKTCLRPVERSLVWNLMEELGGDALIRFVSIEYAARAQTVFTSLRTMLTMENVWVIFRAMMPLMYPA